MSETLDKRGYSWPPFAGGHTKSLTHGAHSPRLIAPLAQSVAEELIDAAPWLAQRAFVADVFALARTEAMVDCVASYLDEIGGPIDDDGKVRPAAEYLVRLERLALQQRAGLGLNPAARARIERDLAGAARDVGDLDGEIDVGRRLRMAAEARQALRKEQADE